MSLSEQARETKEQFLERFPRPAWPVERLKSTRVLVRCHCETYGYDEDGSTISHWAWGWWDFRFPGIDPGMTLAEEQPDFEKLVGRPLTKEDLEL